MVSIEDSIEELKSQLSADLKQASSAKELEALKVKYLGKKGPIQALMSHLKTASKEERPLIGQKINALKNEASGHIESALEGVRAKELDAQLEHETLDITLPGRRHFLGRRHVVLKMLDRVLAILSDMGFSVQYGPDVESEYYNFEALNFAPDHPARDMQDTYYISPDTLLRTHTSNTQVRVMEASKPPIRIIAPGKCYRNEEISARSFVVFHQVEGLYIDKNVTFADLLSTLKELFCRLFHKDLRVRFRPSYFPFVEPGVEVDIHCFICDGKGCSICKHTSWLEVAGAGLVHPEVLLSGGIDPEEYTGYAWGFGIERLAMLEHGISDIRLFYENDLRFLQQF